MLRGAAAPPTIMPRRLLRSYFSLSSSARSPSQSVGTPAVRVTRSAWMSPARSGGVRCGPGNTCVMPSMVAAKGVPQASTWNIGTTGMNLSRSDRPNESAMLRPRLCR